MVNTEWMSDLKLWSLSFLIGMLEIPPMPFSSPLQIYWVPLLIPWDTDTLLQCWNKQIVTNVCQLIGCMNK